MSAIYGRLLEVCLYHTRNILLKRLWQEIIENFSRCMCVEEYKTFSNASKTYHKVSHNACKELFPILVFTILTIRKPENKHSRAANKE